jgi:hypothetical protein
VIRRVVPALGAGFIVAAICAAPAAAQTPDPQPAIDVLTHSAFHLSAEHLSGDDPRFVWDTNFGGDLDLVDYGKGRVNFLANYEAVLGERFRRFDPEQGNYILAGFASHRFDSYEAGVVFHHESRHLSDRDKRQAVDWNMLGGRVLKSLDSHGVHLESRADLRVAVMKSYVDYTWEFDGGARAAYPLDERVKAFVDGDLQFFGVNGEQDRGTQTGARLEGGLHVTGKGAGAELFISIERRVDPYPLDFTTATWLTAGFRLLNK